MKKLRYLCLFVLAIHTFCAFADDEYPTINPMMVFTDSEGDQTTDNSYSGSAPFSAHFIPQAENTSGWSEYYEWRFTEQESTEPFLIRYEEETDYTFTKAGSTRVVLYAEFKKDDDVVSYTQEYWETATPIIVSISESHLDMPNAFSPNGDGINDIYKAKEGWQSLVEFKAAIYNRWGQKLYEWTDPADGWDGTFHGQDVAQGVYFCVVNARGADGIKYHFRRDVNLLRGYNENGEDYE